MFKLSVSTIEKKIFEGDVLSVIVMTDEGMQTFLKEHSYFLGKIMPGELIVKTVEEVEVYVTTEGFYRYYQNILYINLKSIKHIDEININEFEERSNKHESLLQLAQNDIELKRLKSKIEEFKLHIKIKKKYSN